MLSPRILQYGKDEPLSARRLLRAGPVEAVWEDGDLRTVRLGDKEVLRRIYAATRDRNWGTAPNVMSNLAMDVGADRFHISYDVENRLNEIDFRWHGEITGAPDGTIRLSLDGIAHSTFMKNRIGFCVLHPDDIAGSRAVIRHVDGTAEEGVLPRLFVPHQPVRPFAEMCGMAHEVAPGVWADLTFEGDIFEMEDQRNWTDASYKTFSTPLRIPYPVEVAAGTRIHQALTLRMRVDEGARLSAASQTAAEPATAFTIDFSAPSLPMPQIGLGVASDGAPLTDAELERLAALRPNHLRIDLLLSDPKFGRRLKQASDEAARLSALLEVALFIDPANARAEMAALEEVIGFGPHVARWLVFPVREQFQGGTPLAEVLQAARPVIKQFRPDPVYSGTNTDFIFLARSVPPLDLVEGITFSITPQVHAFDNASMVETLGAQGQAVASARALTSGKPVVVSPVTLKMRHNPYATGAIPPTPPDQLPPQVDPRQMSLFAAGWTAASIKHIAEAGAAAITYYETAGWRGVMERADGAPVPEKFPSLPGGVFPVYYVFADIGELRPTRLLPTRSANRLKVDGIAISDGSLVRALVVNLTEQPQAVIVPGLPDEVALRLLDDRNAEDAMQSPDAFRAAPVGRLPVNGGQVRLTLPPYALARLDMTA